MIKLFISQPMKGKTDEEILRERQKALEEVKDMFKDEGIELIDSFIQEAPDDATPLWYLGKSLELMSEADLVYFVDGWENARGCNIEHKCAHEYGITYMQTDMSQWRN